MVWQVCKHNGISHMSGRLKGVLSSCGFYPLLIDPLLNGMVRGNRHAILRYSTVKHKNGHSSSHRASQKLSIGSSCSKLHRASFEGIGMRFYDFLLRHTKTAEYRATERPTSSRSDRSVANSILYRLGSPNIDSEFLSF